MRSVSSTERVLMVVLTVLCIVCFPVNPLVLAGVLEPGFYLPAFVCGWIAWAVGIVLVLAPIVLFPRRGGVAWGESFVQTSRLVDTGIYALVRHPQYLGGILSIFVATPLLYPHWLFVLLGVPGAFVLWWSAREEEKNLVAQFGDAYRDYMTRVPRMNLVSGVVRAVAGQVRRVGGCFHRRRLC